MLEVHTDEQCSCTCLKCPIKLFLFKSHASNQMYTVQDTLVGVYMYFEQILANQLWVPTQNNSWWGIWGRISWVLQWTKGWKIGEMTCNTAQHFSAQLDMCVHVCVCSFSVMVLLCVAWREHNCEKKVWNRRCWVQPGLLSCLKESVGNTSNKFLQISHEHLHKALVNMSLAAFVDQWKEKRVGWGGWRNTRKKKKTCQKKCSILLENSKMSAVTHGYELVLMTKRVH